jgi:hypothetical protein
MVQTRSMKLNKEIPTPKQKEILNFIKIQLVQLENNNTNDEHVLTSFIIFDYIINNIDLIQSYDTSEWVRIKNSLSLKYMLILEYLNDKQTQLSKNELKLFRLLWNSYEKMCILM